MNAMSKNTWSALIPLLVGLLGCARGSDRVLVERVYPAYGKTWHYTAIERYRIRGHSEHIERLLYLADGRGQKLSMNERIFVLQSDGSYKRVECCEGIYTAESQILALDGKLILALIKKRRDATDCVAYPAGRPQDEQFAPEHRINWVLFFGEYDPEERAFYVRDFRARLGDSARTSQLDRGTDWSEKLNAYYYSIRDQLICDAH